MTSCKPSPEVGDTIVNVLLEHPVTGVVTAITFDGHLYVEWKFGPKTFLHPNDATVVLKATNKQTTP